MELQSLGSVPRRACLFPSEPMEGLWEGAGRSARGGASVAGLTHEQPAWDSLGGKEPVSISPLKQEAKELHLYAAPKALTSGTTFLEMHCLWPWNRETLDAPTLRVRGKIYERLE